ncbi:MAG: zinc-dependent alcohol dehydrogenase family protein [Bacteroidia bacterium]|nr:zinc-dependent alcohol dehydrogenase family protein [Bacteroidia bacterium]
MKAWQLEHVSNIDVGSRPLNLREVPVPVAKGDEILIKVICCGVCHTELDEVEGRTPPPQYPIVPGHQVIGIVHSVGEGAVRFKTGVRVGVAWIFHACGVCEYCLSGRENLCSDFVATGRDRNGGYAEYMIAKESFVFPIPDALSDIEAAPLLCAGAIGYRSIKLAGVRDGMKLGLCGFGASGHLVAKVALHLFPHLKLYVFARSLQERTFAAQLGATWAGDHAEEPPAKLDSIIDTTPVWNTAVNCLRYLKPGGRLVINAIRKEAGDQSALLNLRYEDHLWLEKEIKSVANITRADVDEFLNIIAHTHIRPHTIVYSFNEANEALCDLKNKAITGAKVLRMVDTSTLR